MPRTERWFLRRRPSDAFVRSVPKMDPILAGVLYARGIDTPDKTAAYMSDEGRIGNPFSLPDMHVAVSRLLQAIKDRQEIVVYGDFDVDGVSATALMVSSLRMLGGRASPYIPDRFSEAYGLNSPALERLREDGADLVVTVDCGVRSVAQVEHARSIGLDIIITDHHSVPDDLPPALAVIDPKRTDSSYPFSDLAGVGVAHRLVDALSRVLAQTGRRPKGISLPESLLDLVALGTIADIVPLRGENRTLARRGLALLRESERPGVQALIDVAGCRSDGLDSRAVGFRLGPRLNAAGRLKHADLAYDLLMTDSVDEARRLAAELDLVNIERRQLLAEQFTRAQEQVGELDGRKVLVVDAPEFHEGIVGLIASRLVEQFYRPALVVRRDEETSRGSARSIEGFHVTHALDTCSDLLMTYGGHARAAGFSLATKDLPEFGRRLEEHAAEHLPDDLLKPRIDVDAIVPLGSVSQGTASALLSLEPCGEGNREAYLASLAVKVESVRRVGDEGKHLRMAVTDGSRSVSSIGFYQGHLAPDLRPGDLLDIVYTPSLNEWQGEVSLQLLMRALRPARKQAQGEATGQ